VRLLAIRLGVAAPRRADQKKSKREKPGPSLVSPAS